MLPETFGMASLEACRREIEGLHAFFVDWYTGTVERADFGRVEAVIDPSFEMVVPSGEVLDRTAVLEMIRENYDSASPGGFDIDVCGVDLVAGLDRHALARYEEWQRRDSADGETGRTSTVLFREAPDTPEGLAWVALHETYLEE